MFLFFITNFYLLVKDAIPFQAASGRHMPSCKFYNTIVFFPKLFVVPEKKQTWFSFFSVPYIHFHSEVLKTQSVIVGTWWRKKGWKHCRKIRKCCRHDRESAFSVWLLALSRRQRGKTMVSVNPNRQVWISSTTFFHVVGRREGSTFNSKSHPLETSFCKKAWRWSTVDNYRC